jgi:hypothetical protein
LLRRFEKSLCKFPKKEIFHFMVGWKFQIEWIELIELIGSIGEIAMQIARLGGVGLRRGGYHWIAHVVLHLGSSFGGVNQSLRRVALIAARAGRGDLRGTFAENVGISQHHPLPDQSSNLIVDWFST